MSLVPSESAGGAQAVRGGRWTAAPRAAWRLSRVLLHVLYGYVRSWLVWPRLSAAARDAECIRWSRHLLRILGIGVVIQGQARPGAKLVVANHVSMMS